MSTYEGEGDEEGTGYDEGDESTEKTEPLVPQEPPKSEPPPQSCCCLLWSIVWLAVLAAFAWPLSVAMATLYGFVAPFIALIGLDDVSDSMLQAVHVGRECARNVRSGKPMI